MNQSRYNREAPKDESASRERKKTRPIEEQESNRWLETLERSTADISPEMKVITGWDREGDMYELFAKAQDLKEPVLIRIVQNRMTAENQRILEEIRKKGRPGRVEVTLPRDSRSSIPEREAVLQLRYASYSIKRPRIVNKIKTLPEAIDLQVI